VKSFHWLLFSCLLSKFHFGRESEDNVEVATEDEAALYAQIYFQPTTVTAAIGRVKLLACFSV